MPIDYVYTCPGKNDESGVFRPCGRQAVISETGEEGWEGAFHCTRMTRDRLATAEEISSGVIEPAAAPKGAK